MPIHIAGATGYQELGERKAAVNEYPEGLDLRPGSSLHGRLVAYVMSRAQASSAIMKRRYPSWRQIDRTLTAYIPLSELEERVKSKDSRKPVSIVFPYSYAILDTLTAYMDSIFLRSPIFRFEGNSPEDTVGVALMEKVVDIHCKKTKANLALHTAFRDGLAYGLGAVFPMWKQQYGFKTQRDTPLGDIRERVLLFEGNALDTVDPYRLLLDPVVGAKDIQAGEFVAFSRTVSYVDLLEREQNNAGIVNVQYLPKTGEQRSSIFSSEQSAREDPHGRTYTTVGETSSSIDLIFMYARVVPKDLGLGESEVPEKWLFCLAADKYIIQAQPLNADHDMFPVALSAPTFDGYSHTPLSRLEMLDGMQETINWLFNSHIANVRKSVNDMFIVDPLSVNIEDMRDPEPGKLIRLRRAAWGKSVSDCIKQFPVNDVTKQNLGDTQLISSLMHRLSGTDDATMGMLRQGGPDRLTGQEFQGTRQSALGRMEAMVRVISSQLIQDLAYMMASHTQQLMSQDVYVQTSGRWQETLAARFPEAVATGKMKVSPKDLVIDYDLSPVEPTSPSQDVSMWMDLFTIISQQPMLTPLFDVQRIFTHIATQMGAQNIDDFLINPSALVPTAAPTEDVMGQADAGNMVPISEVSDALGRG